MKKTILVTGGMGYIGSHTIVDLLENDYHIVSIDNFSNSFESTQKNLQKITHCSIKNYAVDLCQIEALESVFEKEERIHGVIHFAALKAVNESVLQPIRYYRNNLNGLLNLLACCKKYQIENFVFSSSCSVYGNSEKLPVTENSPLSPSESPYAETKVMSERIIQDFAQTNQLKAVLLRYFNPIGAHSSILIGENSKSDHLNIVPRICKTAIANQEHFKIFGSNYDTKDGTCIRDYIHVSDIAHGHSLSLQWLLNQNNKAICEVFNLGSGVGTSVLELIEAFETSTNQSLQTTLSARRPGDVASIYANNDKAKQILGWKTKYNLAQMMQTAWDWELTLK